MESKTGKRKRLNHWETVGRDEGWYIVFKPQERAKEDIHTNGI